ncbi:MAG: permease-like cell division protein FtsX [Acutalibacteraceae bacterium]|nr:permease-like cell division protein FtsX [Acutalibacteraceae bacterium]
MKGFGYLFKEGIKSVWNNRGMSVASIGILVSSLLITGVAALFCANLQALVEKIGSENVITVYLEQQLPDEDVTRVGKQIESIDNISKISFYSKEEAIKEFDSQLGDLKNEFKGKENPLPDAYKITMIDLEKYDSTAKYIAGLDGVLKVSDKSNLAKTLTELNNIVATLGFWVVFMLGLISLFIISTAIKTTMHSRRFEVSIMKSVGATNAFVRIPFIIEGLVLGVISGIISSILMKFIYEGILSTVQTKYITALEIISFNSVVGYVFAGMVSAGALVGAIGAGISIRRYLKLEGNELLGW